jgi:hypothetical protein
VTKASHRPSTEEASRDFSEQTGRGAARVGFYRGRHAAPGAASWHSVTVMAVPLLGLAYVTLATLPLDFRPIVPGLDRSWVWAINELPYTDAIYGRDVIFSFGPLGYLFVPLDIGSNLSQAIALRVFLHAGLVAVVLYHLLRARRPWAVLMFLPIYLLASTLGLQFEHRALILLAMLLTIPCADRTAWRIAATVAGLLAGALVFTKLSAALATVSLLALTAFTWAVRREITPRTALGFIGLPFAAMVTLLAWLLFGDPVIALKWITQAGEFARGYVEAMTVPGPPLVFAIVVGTVVVYAAAVILISRRDRSVAVIAIPLAAVILLALRHGVVRHNGQFVPAVVLGALALVGLTSSSWRRLIVVIGAAAVVASGSIAMTVIAECRCPWEPASLGPSRGWSDVVSLLDLSDTRARVRLESEARLAEIVLPRDVAGRLRGAGAAVDVLPFEVVMTRANGFRWQPNPVLQTYAAFTPKLDGWVGRHFAGPDRPAFLLAAFTDIDARHPMLTAPATWRSILAGYRPAEARPLRGSFGEILVLEQRRGGPSLDPRTIATETSRWGDWIEVPRPTDDLIFAAVRLESDLSGRLARLVWRIDPVYMDLALADGGQVTVRVVPSTLRNGFLLNHLPLTSSELLQLMTGERPRTISAFRLRGPGRNSFEDAYEVIWRRASWMP